jgi:hypothetical protein
MGNKYYNLSARPWEFFNCRLKLGLMNYVVNYFELNIIEILLFEFY